jgi:hypothetical protein
VSFFQLMNLLFRKLELITQVRALSVYK